MDIEFDTAKDASNLAKHGVSLAFGERIWDDNALVVVPTVRVEDGELRFRAIGLIDGHLWTAVHVHRGTAIRFISVRRSNDAEQRQYDRT